MGHGDPREPTRAALRHLDAMGNDLPAIVCDRHLTVAAANDLARALTTAFLPGTNLARFVFLNGSSRDRTPACEMLEGQVTAMLHESVAHHRSDAQFRRLVGELSALSRRFAHAWASPIDVAPTGEAELVNESVGRLTLTYEKLRPTSGYDDSVFVLSPSDDRSRAALDRLRATLPPSE